MEENSKERSDEYWVLYRLIMYSPSNYIVRPKNNNRYNNTKKIGEVEVIINTSIEDAKDVQREAEVIAIPRLFKTEVQIDRKSVV